MANQEHYNIDFEAGEYKLGLMVNHFKEGDAHILYVPFLRISAYGDTVDEAKEMLDECLQQFYKDIQLKAV